MSNIELSWEDFVKTYWNEFVDIRKKSLNGYYDEKTGEINNKNEELLKDDFFNFGKFLNEKKININFDMYIGVTNSMNFKDDYNRFNGQKNCIVIQNSFNINIYKSEPIGFYININSPNIKQILENNYKNRFTNIYFDKATTVFFNSEELTSIPYSNILIPGGKAYFENNIKTITSSNFDTEFKNNKSELYNLIYDYATEIKNNDIDITDNIEDIIKKISTNIKNYKYYISINKKIMFLGQFANITDNIRLNIDFQNKYRDILKKISINKKKNESEELLKSIKNITFKYYSDAKSYLPIDNPNYDSIINYFEITKNKSELNPEEKNDNIIQNKSNIKLDEFNLKNQSIITNDDYETSKYKSKTLICSQCIYYNDNKFICKNCEKETKNKYLKYKNKYLQLKKFL